MLVCALALTAAPAGAHTLKFRDAKIDADLELSDRSYISEVDVARCWRNNRHRISCFGYWTETGHYIVDQKSYCEGIVSVRFRSRTDYRTRARVVSSDCSYV